MRELRGQERRESERADPIDVYEHRHDAWNVWWKCNTFALQRPKFTLLPAQLATSVAKRLGSGLSCMKQSSSSLHLTSDAWTYNVSTIYADNEVKPGLNGQLCIGILEDLKSVYAPTSPLLYLRL